MKNIDFQTTILSRFDMIFIVKDEHNEQRDRVRSHTPQPQTVTRVLIQVLQMIAKHVMNIHMNRPNQNGDENGEVVGEIDIDKMKRYIAFCKAYVAVPCSLGLRAQYLLDVTGNVHLDCRPRHRRC